MAFSVGRAILVPPVWVGVTSVIIGTMIIPLGVVTRVIVSISFLVLLTSTIVLEAGYGIATIGVKRNTMLLPIGYFFRQFDNLCGMLYFIPR